ncbi:MAG: zinc ribbon domain-containing protein [Verrucomicrobiota bacterium]
MPLIKCHECGEAVSDQARTCPKCGAPVIATIKRGQKRVLVQLGISLIFFAVIMFFVWNLVQRLKHDVLTPPKAQEQKQTTPYKSPIPQ